jgi:hypothetical protein
MGNSSKNMSNNHAFFFRHTCESYSSSHVKGAQCSCFLVYLGCQHCTVPVWLPNNVTMVSYSMIHPKASSPSKVWAHTHFLTLQAYATLWQSPFTKTSTPKNLECFNLSRVLTCAWFQHQLVPSPKNHR